MFCYSLTFGQYFCFERRYLSSAIIFNLILDLLFKVLSMTRYVYDCVITINLTWNDVFNILFLLFPYTTIEIFICCG